MQANVQQQDETHWIGLSLSAWKYQERTLDDKREEGIMKTADISSRRRFRREVYQYTYWESPRPRIPMLASFWSVVIFWRHVSGLLTKGLYRYQYILEVGKVGKWVSWIWERDKKLKWAGGRQVDCHRMKDQSCFVWYLKKASRFSKEESQSK